MRPKSSYACLIKQDTQPATSVCGLVESGIGGAYGRSSGAWSVAGPSLERSRKSARIREAEHRRQILDGDVILTQMLAGEFFAQIVEHLLERRSLLTQATQQGSFSHVQEFGCRPLRYFAIGKLLAQAIAHLGRESP